MNKSVNFKDIEVNERNFRINKMDARTGSFMLFKVIGILSPILKNKTKDQIEETSLDDINIGEVLAALCNISEEDFRYVQDNCLQAVEEILPAGPARVFDKYGNYGVLDIECNTGLVMTLTVHSLIFNVIGFFEGSPLASVMKKFNISQLNLQM